MKNETKDIIIVSILFCLIFGMLFVIAFLEGKQIKECEDICLEEDYEYYRVEKRSCICISEEQDIKYFTLEEKEKR